MKKLFSLIISSTLVIYALTACDFSPAPKRAPDSEKKQKVNSASDSAIPDETSFIGEERAKEIALERAGISSDGVIFDRVELDRDGGMWHYEVDFRKDRTAYDADIKADDGTVLSFESDFDD